jgi:hypothetical protein
MDHELRDYIKRLQHLAESFSTINNNEFLKGAQKFVDKIGKLVMDLEALPVPRTQSLLAPGFLPESDEEDYLDLSDGDKTESLVGDTDSNTTCSPVKVAEKHADPSSCVVPSDGVDEGMDSDVTEDFNEPEPQVSVHTFIMNNYLTKTNQISISYATI